jgi:hypothetical protein
LGTLDNIFPQVLTIVSWITLKKIVKFSHVSIFRHGIRYVKGIEIGRYTTYFLGKVVDTIGQLHVGKYLVKGREVRYM